MSSSSPDDATRWRESIVWEDTRPAPNASAITRSTPESRTPYYVIAGPEVPVGASGPSTTSTPARFALYRAIMTELRPGTDVFYAVSTSPSTVISVRFG